MLTKDLNDHEHGDKEKKSELRQVNTSHYVDGSQQWAKGLNVVNSL